MCVCVSVCDQDFEQGSKQTVADVAGLLNLH